MQGKELAARRVIERIFEEAQQEGDFIRPVDEKSEIRQKALQMFLKHLDGKLANLQHGEHLMVNFRVDIIREGGKVRGGSGSQRNMPEYIEWRSSVFQRDGYKCQSCGVGGSVEAHHIKGWSKYPESRFDIDNGVTLCPTCHAAQHPHLKLIKDKQKHESETPAIHK